MNFSCPAGCPRPTTPPPCNQCGANNQLGLFNWFSNLLGYSYKK